jgi:hypothetical protein
MKFHKTWFLRSTLTSRVAVAFRLLLYGLCYHTMSCYEISSDFNGSKIEWPYGPLGTSSDLCHFPGI